MAQWLNNPANKNYGSIFPHRNSSGLDFSTPIRAMSQFSRPRTAFGLIFPHAPKIRTMAQFSRPRTALGSIFPLRTVAQFSRPRTALGSIFPNQ
jgi:hypothetical protein